MSAHIDPDTLERFVAKTLTAREIAAVDEHLAQCRDCRQTAVALADPTATGRMWARLRTTVLHVSYEQLEAYVDNTLSAAGRQTVEAHLRACAGCARELEDLKAAAPVLSEPLPAQTAAPAKQKAGFGERLMQLLAGGAVMKGAMAALALTFVVTLFTARTVLTPTSGITVEQVHGTSTEFGRFDAKALTSLQTSDAAAYAAYRARDYVRVAQALAPRAAANEPQALSALGLLYATGKGVPLDAKEAARLLREAAKRGDATAQTNLNVLEARERQP
jgi:anti-sigma factor RsiW